MMDVRGVNEIQQQRIVDVRSEKQAHMLVGLTETGS
jgi:hypothetical protein